MDDGSKVGKGLKLSTNSFTHDELLFLISILKNKYNLTCSIQSAAALVCMHLMALHVNGSSNPLGITGNVDRLPMHPYFIFKDLVTVFVFLLIFSLFVFYSPNTLGHPDNYIPGNPLVTPPSIVPE
ncbi:hypothetical protein CANMA_004118 [Candida margitis]|uniref:uncharacterized protein n=1 Tax=Candida margitis TaxID=1775924 RepID=UPI0022268D78|nr:uncharacterized protein CANMA_004118 [Candida margitis]KAI5959324.1 hypothetical protein CANMA_004118 [Candida margitis]